MHLSSELVINRFAPVNTAIYTHTALTNGSGDQGDTDSSQETFELFGSLRKKITGTLFKVQRMI